MKCHQIVDEEESLVRGVVRKRAGADFDDSGNPEASQPPMTSTSTSPKILEMHDGSSYDAPAMITPVKESQSCCILTSSSEDEVDEIQISRQQLDGDAAREEESQSARLSSSDAATQLKLAQGLRTLKRIVECDYLSKDSNESTSNTDHNTLESLHALSDSLSPELGSAMSGLLNAVHMIRDRSKLATQETEDLVQDLHQSQQEASVQRKRARQTEHVARKLYKQNISLKEDVARLRKERRVLVDEVKSLRNQADEMKKLDNWRVLDQHMREAMMNHERIMFSARLKKRAESESSFSDNGKSGGVTSVSSFDSIDSLQFNSGSSSEDVLSVSEGECSQPEHKKDSRTDEYPDGVVTPSTKNTDAKAVEEETSTNNTCEKDQSVTENQSESKQENTNVAASTPQKARLFPGFGGLALGFKALAAEAERASRGIHEKTPQEKVIRKPVSESESKKGEKELLDNKPSETDMFGPVAISEANTTYNPVQISGHFGCKPRQKTAYPETLNSPETCDTTVGSTQGSSRLGASAVTGCTSSSGEDLEKVLMPLSVTFSSRSANENEESSQLGTPSVSPAGTPPGVQVPPLQPICDPQILRSLSIPSSSSREDDYVCFSQEAGADQVGAGLYEC